MARGLLLIASAALALGTLELAIRVFDLFVPARTAIVEASLRGARPADAPASENQLHPFRGWAVRPSLLEDPGDANDLHRNRLGFRSTIDDYRSVDPNDFAIGIFGGSVAASIANQGGDEIVGRLARERPELAGRIRILNLASAAYKQPQQLMVFSEMILLGVEIDYVVNVDGFNEVAVGAVDALAGHHPLFPARANMRFLAEAGRGAPTDAFYEASAQIIRERRAAERIESRMTGWLGHSQLARAFAGALAGRHRRRATELDAELQTSLAEGADSGLMASIPDECLDGKRDCWPLIAGIWLRSSLLMAAQASAIGAGYLHVLQPNQYVPGSKRLTDQERKQAFSPGSIWMTSVRSAYPLLQSRATVLSDRGVDFMDLTPAFADVTESIYTDICCHMTEAGYGMLGERIGKRIAARLASASAAAGLPRRSRGSRPTDD